MYIIMIVLAMMALGLIGFIGYQMHNLLSYLLRGHK